jgi:hypothetical protein
LARKKKQRRWPVLFAFLLLAAILLWTFRPAIEGWLWPRKPSKPTIGKEKVQEEIREEERERLEEILKGRR